MSQLSDINIQVDSIIKIESEDYNRFHPPPPDIDPKDLPATEPKDEKTLGKSVCCFVVVVVLVVVVVVVLVLLVTEYIVICVHVHLRLY